MMSESMLIPRREDDVSWPKKNIVGRQELEVRIDKEHISFEVRFPPILVLPGRGGESGGSLADGQTAKIGSLVDVNESQDAEGLRVFYYLVQDLKVSWSPPTVYAKIAIDTASASSSLSLHYISRSSQVSSASPKLRRKLT
jgi:hypothetical protein